MWGSRKKKKAEEEAFRKRVAESNKHIQDQVDETFTTSSSDRMYKLLTEATQRQSQDYWYQIAQTSLTYRSAYRPLDWSLLADNINNSSVLSSSVLKPTKPTNNTEGEQEDNMDEKLKRRADLAQTRIRDLEDGDKLYMLESNNLAVLDSRALTCKVQTHARDKNYWYFPWKNQSGEFITDWAMLKTETTLLKNYSNGAKLQHLASAVKVDFDSVILTAEKKNQIVEAIEQVNNHDLIFKDWGFGEKFEKGTAISLLFYGLPGTGKTLMGQAIADKFNYKLKVISTAEIETPEPGGAERNIQKHFQEASDGKTVLLFDECDSLIHDRGRVGMIMAAQINALLTALENHKGIVIFTTNRLGSLDTAFERRLSLKLEFPMPDAEHRVMIWKRMFPSQAPVDTNVRWQDLAKVEIAGGHIKNVVLKAARKAAASKAKRITDDIIWDCLENEIASSQAFTEAIDNNQQWYGTPMTSKGMARVREKGEIRRG